MRFFASSLLMVMLTLGASIAVPHHGASLYDREMQVTFEGVVARFNWTSPHVYLFVAEMTGLNEPVMWEVEFEHPFVENRLHGWSQDTFVAGDHVIVTGHPARNTSKKSVLPVSIERDDGTDEWDYSRASFEEALYGDRGVRGATDSLSGVWVVDPAGDLSYFDPASYPLTDVGAAALEEYRRNSSPNDECRPLQAPGALLFHDAKRILIDDDVALIRAELFGTERTVHLNIASHDDATVSTQGHSIGWWEGQVLVIDTTHFTENRWGNGANLPSGSRKHLVERFELNPNGMGLTYSYRLEDPEYLAAPVTSEVQWLYRPALDFTSVECDLESARHFLGE
jgi:hypothetical protein